MGSVARAPCLPARVNIQISSFRWGCVPEVLRKITRLCVSRSASGDRGGGGGGRRTRGRGGGGRGGGMPKRALSMTKPDFFCGFFFFAF